MPLVQCRERLQQAFADIGRDRGRRLASTDELSRVEINGDELGERAAEIDEKSVSGHVAMEQSI
jgi:hypothetical protein